MRPQLYVGGGISVLVDEDSLVVIPNENGDLTDHYLSAVFIGGLQRTGMIHHRQLAKVDTDGNIVAGEPFLYAPDPIVWEVRHTEGMRKAELAEKRIQPRAAVVLLNLAASKTVATVGNGRKLTFGTTPALRGVAEGWCKWKFLAAWQWSFWQDWWMKGPEQHKSMQNLGYPEDAGRLRVMISRLGLSKK